MFRRKKNKKIKRLNKNVMHIEIWLFILKHFPIIDVKRSSNNPLRMSRFLYLTNEENQGLDTLCNWFPVICVLMTEFGQKSIFLTYKKMTFSLVLQQQICPSFSGSSSNFRYVVPLGPIDNILIIPIFQHL